MLQNLRIKRLLDKKKTALAMPKHKLMTFENEYMDLLDRIEKEKEVLGLDPESILKFKESCRLSPAGGIELSELDDTRFKTEIQVFENLLDKAAANGDLDNVKYYKSKLQNAWKDILTKSLKNQQTSLFK